MINTIKAAEALVEHGYRISRIADDRTVYFQSETDEHVRGIIAVNGWYCVERRSPSEYLLLASISQANPNKEIQATMLEIIKKTEVTTYGSSIEKGRR